MKLGTENRPATIIALVLLAVGVFMIVRTFGGGGNTAGPSKPAAAAAAPARTPARPRRVRGRAAQPAPNTEPAVSLDPRLRLDLLKASEDTEYKGTGRNIFRAEAEPVKIEKPVTSPIKSAQNTPPVVNAGPPVPPPMDLKFFGFASEPGQQKKVFLAHGEDVFVAAEGDIVDRRYKIVKIGASSIEVQDVLNNNRQTIPLTQG